MLRIGRVSWQAVMCTLSCDCVWLFFHILNDKLDAWASLPTASSTGKWLLCLSAGRSATWAESLVMNGFKVFFLLWENSQVYRGTKISFETRVNSWNYLECGSKPSQNQNSGVWVGFGSTPPWKYSSRTIWALDILLPIFWYFLIWIFISYHVPWLKAEHCNSQ